MIEFRTSHGDRPVEQSSHEAYEEIYRTEPIRQTESFYRWALGLAAPCPGQRLLDVSCGVGRLVDLAGRAGLRGVGIDLATAAVETGQAERVRGDLLVGDAEMLPFADASFDRVVNLGSIEHYDHPARGVAEMARVLRPDGKAIILLPNSFGYQHVLYVWRHGRVFDDGQPLQRYGAHANWRQLLEGNGLRVRRVEKYQYVRPRTWADFCWYLRRPFKLLQMLATPLVPLNAVNCFVFICGRNADLQEGSNTR